MMKIWSWFWRKRIKYCLCRK